MNFIDLIYLIPSLPLRLLKVQDRAKECLQEHLREVTSISSEATRVSHNLVDLLDESNTTYRASIK